MPRQDFASLKSTLAQSVLAKKDDALYKTIQNLLDKLTLLEARVKELEG